jgi:hypothetical protein
MRRSPPWLGVVRTNGRPPGPQPACSAGRTGCAARRTAGCGGLPPSAAAGLPVRWAARAGVGLTLWMVMAACGACGEPAASPPHGPAAPAAPVAPPPPSASAAPARSSASDPSRPQGAAPSQRVDGPSLVACEAACANVRAVLAQELRDLPEGGRALLGALEEPSGPACVAACQARGDATSVACVTAATSLLALGGCGAAAPGAARPDDGAASPPAAKPAEGGAGSGRQP